MVLVNHGHAAFDVGRKALKRRFGNIIQSPKHGLTAMLASHRAQVTGWLEERIEQASGEDE